MVKRFRVTTALLKTSLLAFFVLHVFAGLAPVYGQEQGAPAAFERAQAFAEQDNYKKACKVLEKSLQQDSLTAEQQDAAYLNLAGWYEKRTNKDAEAKYYYKRLILKELPVPQTAVADKAQAEYQTLQAAHLEYANSQYAPAKITLDKLLLEDMTPKDKIDVNYLAGRVNANLGDAESARKNFKQVLKADKKFTPDQAAISDQEYTQFMAAQKEFNSAWERTKRTPGNIWHWKYTPYVGGAVVVGVVACILICDDDDGGKPLPNPPALPQ